MPKINRETYGKATIDTSDNDNLNSFVLAIKIIEDIANEIQPYVVYENLNEISVAIGEYIGIEVYTDKILITENRARGNRKGYTVIQRHRECCCFKR